MEIVKNEFLALIDYEEAKQIKLVNGNREIRDNHVLDLIKNQNMVKDGKWNQLEPITVDFATWELHNGQHRRSGYFYAHKHGLIPPDSKLYVLFKDYGEQTESEKITTIKNENSVLGWTYKDGIKSEVVRNDPNYIELTKWCIDHPLCHDEKSLQYRNAAAMMFGRRFDFTKQYFTFDSKKAEYAHKIHEELVKILKLLNMSRGDACVESIACSWYNYSYRHEFSVWEKYIQFTRKNKKDLCDVILNNPKTKSKKMWDNFFDLVESTIK